MGDYMKKKKMIILLLVIAVIAGAYFRVTFAEAKTSSELTIHEREYHGGIAGMDYSELRTLKNVKLSENKTIYRNLLYGISIKACDISDESVRLKLSDRAFVEGAETREIVVNKGDDVTVTFANDTTGIELQVLYE
jgi:hypothetical protein